MSSLRPRAHMRDAQVFTLLESRRSAVRMSYSCGYPGGVHRVRGGICTRCQRATGETNRPSACPLHANKVHLFFTNTRFFTRCFHVISCWLNVGNVKFVTWNAVFEAQFSVRGCMLSFAAWFIPNIVVISVLEHLVHRHLMHRRPLPPQVYRWFPVLSRYLHAHATLHHTIYYRRFNFEPDPVGREVDMRLSLKTGALLYLSTIPLLSAMAWVDPICAASFSVAITAHMYLWGQLHHEMHIPASRFIQSCTSYRLLARYHYLHHRYPRKNFNVVIPLADFLFGTLAQARQCDLREMIRLGYLTPHHPKTLERLDHRKECPSLPAHRAN